MSKVEPEENARLGRWQIVRYVMGVLVGAIVLFALFSQRGDLVAAWHQVVHLNWGWTVVAVLSEFSSILSFAYLQRRVLRCAGSSISTASLLAISLANNAIANTVPGEPAVSSAFRYRQYRRRGASSEASGWTILTIIIAQAIGMSTLILIGVLISLVTSPQGHLTEVTLVGLVIVLAAGGLLIRRDLLLRFLGAAVRGIQRISGHPRGDIALRVSTTLERMHQFKTGIAITMGIVALATLTWLLDFGCLLSAFGAVHARIPRDGVLLAYGVAQIVAVLPLVPGGLGLVEGSLAVILVAYGATRVPALSTVLVYRFVNYWLAVSMGWTVFGIIMYRGRRVPSKVGSAALPPSDFDRGMR
jgi:uncharacterized protein (TIRG00374 family)